MNIDHSKNYLTNYWQCDDEDADLEFTLMRVLRRDKIKLTPLVVPNSARTESQITKKNGSITHETGAKMFQRPFSTNDPTNSPKSLYCESPLSGGNKKEKMIHKDLGTLETITDIEQGAESKTLIFTHNTHQALEQDVKDCKNINHVESAGLKTERKERTMKKNFTVKLMPQITPSTLDESGEINSHYCLRRHGSDVYGASPRQPSLNSDLKLEKKDSDPFMSARAKMAQENMAAKLKIKSEIRLNFAKTRANTDSEVEELLESPKLQNVNKKPQFGIYITEAKQSEMKEEFLQQPKIDLFQNSECQISRLKLPKLENIKSSIRHRPSQSTAPSDVSDGSVGSNCISPLLPRVEVERRKSKFWENHHHHPEGTVFKAAALGNLQLNN